MAESSRRYLIVTPCRDEEDHLEVMIGTIAAQSVLPTLWIIVDDGSTDRTPEILSRAAEKYNFIRVYRREDRGGRSVGPGVVEAFYDGLEQASLDDYDYVTKLDADLELPSRYFETCMEQMEREPLQGNFSGKLYVRVEGGREVNERTGDENAIGPAKFYRVACFKAIGGFVRQVSWDGIDGHLCRMNGWIAESRDEPELRIIHRRLMGSSQENVWIGRLRWGRGKYFMGSAWYYVWAVSFYRMFERPFIVGGLGILLGYYRALHAGMDQYDNPDFRRYLRRYELSSLILGKRRTFERSRNLS